MKKNFATDLHRATKTEHDDIQKLAFISRYTREREINIKVTTPQDRLTLLDHYRHLKQLYEIYLAFEDSYAKHQVFAYYVDDTDFFRSNKIKQDLDFLAKYINDKECNEILNSTKLYAYKIRKLDNLNEFLGHFVTRIIGDTFGGQLVSEIILKLYERKNLLDHSEQQTLNDHVGVSFYHFTSGFCAFRNNFYRTTQQMIQQKYVDSHQICQAAKKAFEKNSDIFKELEKTRKNHTPWSSYKGCMWAMTATVAMIGVGVTTYRNFQPK